MADGIAGPTGAGVPVEFGGETLILDPLTLKDFGLIERHLLRRRKNPLEVVREAVKDLPPDLAEKLLERAYEDAKKESVIPASEVVEFLDSLEGVAFSYWIMFEKRYPGKFSIDQCLDIMQGLSEEELEERKRARDEASGLDVRGNSAGQTQTKNGERERKTRRRRRRRS